GRERRGDRRAKKDARGMARSVAVSSAKRARVAERRGYIFSRKVACHSRKNSFGNCVKIRGSTSERERSRRREPCLGSHRNAHPLFTDVDPGADVQCSVGELCIRGGNRSASAGRA